MNLYEIVLFCSTFHFLGFKSFHFSYNNHIIIDILTFVVVLRSNREHGVLYVFVFIDFGLVQRLIEIRRVVVLVRDTDPYKLGYCGRHQNRQYCNMIRDFAREDVTLTFVDSVNLTDNNVAKSTLRNSLSRVVFGLNSEYNFKLIIKFEEKNIFEIVS